MCTSRCFGHKTAALGWTRPLPPPQRRAPIRQRQDWFLGDARASGALLKSRSPPCLWGSRAGGPSPDPLRAYSCAIVLVETQPVRALVPTVADLATFRVEQAVPEGKTVVRASHMVQARAECIVELLNKATFVPYHRGLPVLVPDSSFTPRLVRLDLKPLSQTPEMQRLLRWRRVPHEVRPPRG